MPRGFYRLAKAEYTRLTSPDEDGNPVAIPDAHVVADTGPQVYLHAARYPHKWLLANADPKALEALGQHWSELWKKATATARGKAFGRKVKRTELDAETDKKEKREKQVKVDGVITEDPDADELVPGPPLMTHAWGARETAKQQAELAAAVPNVDA